MDMSLQTTPDDSPFARPPRPILVWVIAVVVICATAFRLFSLAMVPGLLGGSSDISDEQRQFFESQTSIDYALAIITVLGNATGAVLFLLLRRAALYVFVGALTLSIADTVYEMIAKDWLAAVGTTGLVVALLGYAVNIAIVFYSWLLFRKGILR